MSNNPRSGDRRGEHEFKIRRRPKTPAKACGGCGTCTPLHLDTCTAVRASTVLHDCGHCDTPSYCQSVGTCRVWLTGKDS